METRGFLADRRDLGLQPLTAVGLTDMRRRKGMADASGNDCSGLGDVRLAGVLRGSRGRSDIYRWRARRGTRLVGRARRRLRGCRCKPGRGQGNRPSNQSHLHPGSGSLEPLRRGTAPQGFGRSISAAFQSLKGSSRRC